MGFNPEYLLNPSSLFDHIDDLWDKNKKPEKDDLLKWC